MYYLGKIVIIKKFKFSKSLLVYFIAIFLVLIISNKSEHLFTLASYKATGGLLVTGTKATILSSTSSGNVGNWQGTPAQDATAPGWNWTVNTLNLTIFLIKSNGNGSFMGN